MGTKDITEKALEAYNDVFADIVNVLCFQGRPVIKEEELEEAAPRSHYKASHKIHEMERDVTKFWKRHNIRIALYGLENQTSPDKFMPLRVVGYDGAAYRAQLLDADKTDRPKSIFPVVTLVLYFGRTRWKQPLSLFETLDVPDELTPYVNDYKINLFEIAYLTDEQVSLFQSDFRFVADYFVQSRKNRNYAPAPGTIRHIHETLELLSALTGDLRFEEACRSLKGDETTMSEAILDRMEEKFTAKGIEKGEQNAILFSIQSLMDSMHWSVEQAMAALKIPECDRAKYASILLFQPKP